MPQSLALLEPKGLPAPGGPAPHGIGAGPGKGFKLFGEDGLTFDDLLDVINPLHHLPIVGFIYRAVTGDTISPASRITGGALFGGPLGLAASLADTVLKEASGRDAGGHLLSLVQGEDGDEGLLELKPDTQPDPYLETASSLRYDANEFEDCRPLVPETDTAPTAIAEAPAERGRSFRSASLRYDDHDTYSADSDEPAPTSGVNHPVTTATATPATAAIAPRAAIGLRKAHPAGNPGRVANAAAVPAAAQAAVGSRLPAARTLAANPTMITAMRKGESPYFRPGGNLNSNTWLKLMHNARTDRKSGTPPTGAGGLSSAAIAKALAKYGAAAEIPAAAPRK